MPVSEMHTVCRHVPTTIPTHKPARVVIYHSNFGVPCGGTHVADMHDIGAIAITKVKTKKGLTKVSYVVEGIN
jgi:Ser-tRNA(Ala) deacylase AlaX